MSRGNKFYETWWETSTPASNPADPGAVVVANRFVFNVDCWLIGGRYFRDLADAGNHLLMIRDDPDYSLIRTALFPVKEASGTGADDWESVYLSKRIRALAGSIYQIGVWFSAGNYWRTLDELAGGDSVNGNITMQGDDPTLHINGLYTYATDLLPLFTFRSPMYGVDPIIWVE